MALLSSKPNAGWANSFWPNQAQPTILPSVDLTHSADFYTAHAVRSFVRSVQVTTKVGSPPVVYVSSKNKVPV